MGWKAVVEGQELLNELRREKPGSGNEAHCASFPGFALGSGGGGGYLWVTGCWDSSRAGGLPAGWDHGTGSQES